MVVCSCPGVGTLCLDLAVSKEENYTLVHDPCGNVIDSMGGILLINVIVGR